MTFADDTVALSLSCKPSVCIVSCAAVYVHEITSIEFSIQMSLVASYHHHTHLTALFLGLPR